MSQFELLTLIVATGSFLTGLGTILMALITNNRNDKISLRQTEMDKNIAKRQGVYDLHTAWSIVKDLDIDNYITPDIVKAINALSLTASVWNHDALEKELIYQSYWDVYKSLYDKVNIMTKLTPGCNYTPKSKLTPDISKAYKEMGHKQYFKTLSTQL